MKDRLLSGWSFRRVLYLLVGAMVILFAIQEQRWWAILLGGYFAAMGLFAFGCASGTCSVINYSSETGNQTYPDKTEATEQQKVISE